MNHLLKVNTLQLAVSVSAAVAVKLLFLYFFVLFFYTDWCAAVRLFVNVEMVFLKKSLYPVHGLALHAVLAADL